jgi:hypothetical protein
VSDQLWTVIIGVDIAGVAWAVGGAIGYWLDRWAHPPRKIPAIDRAEPHPVQPIVLRRIDRFGDVEELRVWGG